MRRGDVNTFKPVNKVSAVSDRQRGLSGVKVTMIKVEVEVKPIKV